MRMSMFQTYYEHVCAKKKNASCHGLTEISPKHKWCLTSTFSIQDEDWCGTIIACAAGSQQMLQHVSFKTWLWQEYIPFWMI